MDKSAARAQWKSHQQKKSRAKGYRPSDSKQVGRQQIDESKIVDNSSRYLESHDEESDGEHIPGIPERKSTGEDWQALLDEAALHVTGHLPRHRAFHAEDAINLELAATKGVSAEDDPLAFNLHLLAEALEHLPLHQVLGVDEKYLPESLRAPTTSQTNTQDSAASPHVPPSPRHSQQSTVSDHCTTPGPTTSPPPKPNLTADASASIPPTPPTPSTAHQTQPSLPPPPLSAAAAPSPSPPPPPPPPPSTSSIPLSTHTPLKQASMSGEGHHADDLDKELDDLLGLTDTDAATPPLPSLGQQGGVNASSTSGAQPLPSVSRDMNVQEKASKEFRGNVHSESGSSNVKSQSDISRMKGSQELHRPPELVSVLKSNDVDKDEDWLDELLS